GIADFDNNGYLDIVGSDNAVYPDIFYRCHENLSCERIDPGESGLDATTRFFKWAVGAYDLDDDGQVDLLGANGLNAPADIQEIMMQMQPLPEGAYFGPFNARAQLLLGSGDRFEELMPGRGDGLLVATSQRGAAFGDLDGDGDVDVVLTASGERPLLLWNQLSAPSGTSWQHGSKAHPLNVTLVGTLSGADPVGSRVTVRARDRTLRAQRIAGGSFLGTSDSRLHFGLGDRGAIDEIRVQ